MKTVNESETDIHGKYADYMAYVFDSITTTVIAIDNLLKADPTFLDKTNNGTIMNREKMFRLRDEMRRTEFVGVSVSTIFFFAQTISYASEK